MTTTTDTGPFIVVCPNCGSDNVTRDACTSWDPEIQDWELSAVYDDMHCDDCGYEAHTFNEQPIEG